MIPVFFLFLYHQSDVIYYQLVQLHTPIIATITTTNHPGVYTICCSPITNGHHQFSIQVNDVQVDSHSLVILFNPYLDNITPVCTIPELNKPRGVAVTDDGHIIVSEYGCNYVTILDRDGKKVSHLVE